MDGKSIEARTVVGCPPHRLGPVPTWEGVRRKSRMDEGEVGPIKDMIQVVVIIVDLRRGKLPLIDDILGRKGADVETLCKCAYIEGNEIRVLFIKAEKLKMTYMLWVAYLRRTYS
jgi:hypothetical protein